MRFNVAAVFAILATTSLVVAAPVPVKWNDKDAETVYKAGSRACAGAAYACNKYGHPKAATGLLAAAGAFGAAEIAVTASQGDKFPKAAKAVKNAVVATKNHAVAGAKCVGAACKSAYKHVTGHKRDMEDSEDSEDYDEEYENEEENKDESAALLVARYIQPSPKAEAYDLN